MWAVLYVHVLLSLCFTHVYVLSVHVLYTLHMYNKLLYSCTRYTFYLCSYFCTSAVLQYLCRTLYPTYCVHSWWIRISRVQTSPGKKTFSQSTPGLALTVTAPHIAYRIHCMKTWAVHLLYAAHMLHVCTLVFMCHICAVGRVDGLIPTRCIKNTPVNTCLSLWQLPPVCRPGHC